MEFIALTECMPSRERWGAHGIFGINEDELHARVEMGIPRQYLRGCIFFTDRFVNQKLWAREVKSGN